MGKDSEYHRGDEWSLLDVLNGARTVGLAAPEVFGNTSTESLLEGYDLEAVGLILLDVRAAQKALAAAQRKIEGELARRVEQRGLNPEGQTTRFVEGALEFTYVQRFKRVPVPDFQQRCAQVLRLARERGTLAREKAEAAIKQEYTVSLRELNRLVAFGGEIGEAVSALHTRQEEPPKLELAPLE